MAGHGGDMAGTWWNMGGTRREHEGSINGTWRDMNGT